MNECSWMESLLVARDIEEFLTHRTWTWPPNIREKDFYKGGATWVK